jgi:ATP-dependent RNA helicase DDX21
LTPTRELANQVKGEFTALAQTLTVFCIYGGVSYEPQEAAMRRGIDVLVGTPGRVLDHVQQGKLNLRQLHCVVLDEADQMLEKGFAETMDEILGYCFPEGCFSANNKPQMLLFSATIPPWVSQTANKFMTTDRVTVDLVGKGTTRAAINVNHLALCCQRSERPSIICDIIQVYSGAHGRSMVFSSTKVEANELALNSVLKQECQVLHGDIPQQQREITLRSFRDGKFPVLVATDVAARGLDIPEVDLVIQCEPPADVDAYIHRSGRTGRAGRSGVCVMLYRPNQEYMIPLVERKARIQFQRIGAPRSDNIIRAAGSDAIKCIESVSDNVLEYFKESALQLINDKGPEQAICAALAYISGYTEVTSRSLLTSEQGYTTFMMSCTFEIRGPGYFWNFMERRFNDSIKNAVKGMRMMNDNKV